MTTRRCRRPIGEHETPQLAALGRFLRATRHDAALTQTALARTAQIGERHVRDLERGTRRTRESTLRRLAAALTPSDAPPGTVDALTAHMVAIAGPALAPESAFVERIAARRARRAANQARNTFELHQIDYVWLVNGVAERHVRYWRDGGRRWRHRLTYVLPTRENRRRLHANPDLIEPLFRDRPLQGPRR